ncbi:hypothetical protein HYH02_002181 [Chlamydomonas schloesseri]|uniref:Protein kinase domain-containing protein n=1 Tax=Chlamydomonas schloesseri TaxID=2026947 RepID=A0A835WUP8_9CHLO|nr:hypothetical protein HYH02_002181 [Chlamydomonas schloesseri]|eukprot:KAG2452835.1 hypothetical protein HYH02_002181 [Chlamydomonas schloesseri]
MRQESLNASAHPGAASTHGNPVRHVHYGGSVHVARPRDTHNALTSSLQDVTVGRFGHHHQHNISNLATQQLRHANSLADFGSLVIPTDGSTHHGGHFHLGAGLSPSASQAGNSGQLPVLPAHLAEAFGSSPGPLSVSQPIQTHGAMQHGGSGGIPLPSSATIPSTTSAGIPQQQQQPQHRREYVSCTQMFSMDGRAAGGLGGSGPGAISTGGGQRAPLKQAVAPLGVALPSLSTQPRAQQLSPAGSPLVVPGSPCSAVSNSSNATAWRRLFSSRDNGTSAPVANTTTSAGGGASGGTSVMAQQAAALATLALPSPLQHRTGPSDAPPQAAGAAGGVRMLASPISGENASGNSEPLCRAQLPPRHLLTQQRSVNYQATAAAIAAAAVEHHQQYVHSNSSPCGARPTTAATDAATNGSSSSANNSTSGAAGKPSSPPVVASATITPTPALAIASRAGTTGRAGGGSGDGNSSSSAMYEGKTLKHACASADQVTGGLAAASSAAAGPGVGVGGGPMLHNLSAAIQLANSLSGPANLADMLPSPQHETQQQNSSAAAAAEAPAAQQEQQHQQQQQSLQLLRIATSVQAQQQQQQQQQLQQPTLQWASSPSGAGKAAAAAGAAAGAAATSAATTPAGTASAAAADGGIGHGGVAAAAFVQTELLAQGRNLPAGMRRAHWCLEDYNVTRRLFKGSRTAVYKATCKHSGVAVALKVYFLAKTPNNTLHQIVREIQIHASLSHHNVLPLYAAFQDPKRLVLVLEHAARGDLYNLHANVDRQLNEDQARQAVLEPLLDALGYLHSKGVCHRDIKPENILYTADWCLRVADFGVAINLNDERAVTRAGTADYMAPEVERCPLKVHPSDNKNNPQLGYSTAADVWSIGILAYELMVGFPPVLGEPQAANASCPSAPSISFPASVSAAARDFVTQALALRPEDRPTVHQLRAHPWMAPAVAAAAAGAVQQSS